ncbi:SDR family oxidoreductase [Sphingobium sp. Sx8-8]|uniref:SDR family NAD(P)-dependent oxidoreductase n=1 Tax=Sphingobium sp. Sx8-8 TaxID=2933617 RepID=UPI001F56A3E7|nr:SDR family oxidoreductase [Sphingobium sp. Sx8-8]
MADLKGKTALVTGASRGIGTAVARRLAADGAAVIVNYVHSEAEATALVNEIVAKGGQAFAVQGDCSDLASIDRMVSEIKGRVDSIDILVNNAGRGSQKSDMTLAGCSVEEFDALFGLNTRGLFFLTQKVLPLLRDGGRIVNFSSTAVLARLPGLGPYAGTKAAVDAFTRAWAVELSARRITVNSIQPGMIDTDFITRGMGDEAKVRFASRHPQGRIGTPEDMADLVALLVSDDSRWVSGESIIAAGGV